jgi:tRNA-modifying protein YgfZ
MTTARIAELPRRGVIAVSGPDAHRFLNDLVTANVATDAGHAVFAGLLTPQGKLLFDFLIFTERDRYLFDIARSEVDSFLKRLTLYRLRSKVELADLSDERIVVAAWGSATAPIVDGVVARDPRLADLGFRAVVPPGADMAPDFDEATDADYDAHRIALGVPEGGIDFAFGDVFPHDVDMDQLAGVDFAKGCFVGQEVVSRMKHRGTARRRILIASGDALPPFGTSITADAKALGTMGTSTDGRGLAVIRLDRAKEAMDRNLPILAGACKISLSIPEWADFEWPTAATPD